MKALIIFVSLVLCVSAKGIKQQMVENRLKFDRDVIAHGFDDDDEDYDEWDPWWDLEEEELEDLLRKLHIRMDSNSDGYVDQEELIVWSLIAMFNINGHEASEDWDVTEMDDEKQEMSYQDVLDELYDYRLEGDADIHTVETFDKNDRKFWDYNRLYNRNNARFNAADLNDNGMLSKAEWILFNNPTKDDSVKNTMYDMALENIDENRDGKLSLKEYMSDWHDKPDELTEDEERLEIDQFNDEMDRDNNGFLENEELLFWLHPDNTFNAIDEAEHLIDMCDEDDDDKLTAEEVIEETDLWVDSVGTEYGKTLRHLDEL